MEPNLHSLLARAGALRIERCSSGEAARVGSRHASAIERRGTIMRTNVLQLAFCVLASIAVSACMGTTEGPDEASEEDLGEDSEALMKGGGGLEYHCAGDGDFRMCMCQEIWDCARMIQYEGGECSNTLDCDESTICTCFP
jgi:hypothetical protein